VSTLFIMVGHLTVSEAGSFHRYVLYAVAAVLPACLVMARDVVAGLSHPYRAITVAILGLVAVGTIKPMMADTMLVPTASREIYQQQVQMARFVNEYWRQPVAVNDIGLVSLRSDVHVLDVWGLADRQARIARVADEPGWLGETVRRDRVRLVMIYEPPFVGEIPDGWKKVAELTRDKPRIGWWFPTVAFFATEEDALGPLCKAVEDFAETTPTGSTVANLCPITSPDQAG
jgi:hypothetical protein